MKMKLPVIRGRIGDWVYYSGLMTFAQIDDSVTPSIGEIYQASCLDELLQRDLTKNYEDISRYLLNDSERFFNALILAIYDGDPQWLEVEFPTEEREYTNVGFLQFSGRTLNRISFFLSLNLVIQIKGMISSMMSASG